ncbi:NAD(P)H-binding protein [Rhodococcus sp. CH91]|uniref:NAD(P)H-binding protein n=1 Tax=Rhodococcus sp. CH91 TaxID=2910256 RepID=UPI0035A941EE
MRPIVAVKAAGRMVLRLPPTTLPVYVDTRKADLWWPARVRRRFGGAYPSENRFRLGGHICTIPITRKKPFMIFVTGATGQLGRQVINHLLDRGVPADRIIAVDRESSKVDSAALGVEFRCVDYDWPDTLRTALVGAKKVLLVSSPAGADQTRIRRGSDGVGQPRRPRRGRCGGVDSREPGREGLRPHR